jgi:hypothetical protein
VTGSQRFLGHGKHDVTGLEPPYNKVNSVKLERRHDFSHFADSVHVDWSPKNMDLSEYHDQSQPYHLRMLR